MKVLLVGMDGAHLEVFNRGWTPFISSLLESKKQLNIKNDLISRGWLEIATGQHARKTGALYDKPKADGSLRWGASFSVDDIPGFGSSVKPIWQALNEKGYRVGIMNLPTTFPAPAVDGFFVSGGGGGAPVVQKPTPELCYPQEILPMLHENDYIVDERLSQLVIDKKLTRPSEIFSRMIYKNERRTSSFVELSNKYKIDFGFVVYKTSSNLAEAMFLAERNRCQDNINKIDKNLIEAIKTYYLAFDKEIEKLYKSFPNTEVIFVSDHGMVTREYSVNLNVFLQEIELQTIDLIKKVKKKTIERIKKITPFFIKVYLKKGSVISGANIDVANFDSRNTKAFCYAKGDWVHGIYINDDLRFGGPVSVDNIDKVKNEIVERFNSHPDVIKHKLHAFAVSKEKKETLNSYPDIVIDLPDGYLTTNVTKDFISKFSPSGNSSTLASIMKGDMLYMKSHTPLAVTSCEIESQQNEMGNEERNLTRIYDLILNYFS